MYQPYIYFLQITISLGLLNVWLLRANRVTSFRGGVAKSLKEEFSFYGLPVSVFYLVGFIKISSAILLILGIFFPYLTFLASAVVAILMIGAVIMHVKVHDPLIKTVPASTMFIMSLLLALGSGGF
ncbi:MAG TPA: DoxX family protein [Oligoflexia bacterium]|nr:DoxX family protein [Oligoflexia bacterium]HMP49480.1 DoxX family protein [Oligoflexia bacterium]